MLKKTKISFVEWCVNNIDKDFINKYWDFNKNVLNPFELTKCSSKNVFIKCQKDNSHESYSVTCSHFTSSNSRCPYCSGHKVSKNESLGFRIELLEIWSDLNIKNPYDYTANSNQYVYWKCENKKHKDYYRAISDSNKCNYKCPFCVRERKESKLQEKVRMYLESFNYTILHEHNCTIIPKSVEHTRGRMPYDNEIKEIKLLIEVHGEQHYKINGFHKKAARYKKITIEESFEQQQFRDIFKKEYAIKNGYNYLEIPYWSDDNNETWKNLIDNKIKEVKGL